MLKNDACLKKIDRFFATKKKIAYPTGHFYGGHLRVSGKVWKNGQLCLLLFRRRRLSLFSVRFLGSIFSPLALRARTHALACKFGFGE